MIKYISDLFFNLLDRVYLAKDREKIRRSRNIALIPTIRNRRGGKISYAEWAHVIGIFQTLFHQHLNGTSENSILDVGCGTGLLGIAAEPFVQNGSYVGIDVSRNDIEFCTSHFDMSNYKFKHLDLVNQSYAHSQSETLVKWQIEDESKELVTALSVWTHLNEEHAIFYFKEISRVLKSGGKAIVTMFYLDDKYQHSLSIRQNENGRFHSTNQKLWVFDQKAYDSDDWRTPSWTKHPEEAIGILPNGLNILLDESKLKLLEYLPGNWKEQPGVYFQDIIIFEKD